jgi:Holliday junction resolvase-like predicted endonuclease
MYTFYVEKTNGQSEAFSEEKLARSLKKAGVAEFESAKFINILKKNLYQGITTEEIAERIHNYLEKSNPNAERKYGLRQALMEMGPSGFPFEKLVSALLKKYSYKTKCNTLLQGHCVVHEIDVIAEKQNRIYFVECKYHNSVGSRSDLKVTLYVKARADDIISKIKELKDKSKETKAWIFTNTKFSKEAIAYGECMNLRLTGWNYPEKTSLQKMIEDNGLYPITMLSMLNRNEKMELLKENIILAAEVLENDRFAKILNLSKDRQEKIINEAKMLFS